MQTNRVRVNFAITNNLGNTLFRGEADNKIRDSDRTSSTTWVHSLYHPK